METALAITETDLSVDLETLSIEQSADYFTQARRGERYCQWAQAEVCASVQRRFGHSDALSFVEAVRSKGERFFSKSKFYSYADTWRKFQNSRNLEKLPFSHYTLAAQKAETPEQADNFIAAAVSLSENKGRAITYLELESHIDHRQAQEESASDDDESAVLVIKPITLKVFLSAEAQADLAEIESYYATDSREQAVLEVIREKAKFIRNQWKRIAA